jgi:transposase
MSNCTRYLGLDVHAETITAAIAEGRGQIRSLGKFPNRPEAVRKLVEKLGGGKNLKVCYEAGPTGYALYWQLAKLGVDCEVIAPSLIPKKAGDKVKTDRRDAEKLARSYQAGDLTPVWVPTPEHEALRDLVRQRYGVQSFNGLFARFIGEATAQCGRIRLSAQSRRYMFMSVWYGKDISRDRPWK